MKKLELITIKLEDILRERLRLLKTFANNLSISLQKQDNGNSKVFQMADPPLPDDLTEHPKGRRLSSNR